MTIPLDAESLVALYRFVAKGLAFHHWQILMPEGEVIVDATWFIPEGAHLFERLLSVGNCNSTGSIVLGGGEFCYQGSQWLDYPQVTFWRFNLYGAEMSARANGREYLVSTAYAMTTPKTQKAAVGVMSKLFNQPAAA
jgi:hypothetical protein